MKALEWGKEYSERTDGSGYFSVEAQTIVGRYSAYRMDATKQWILEFEREVLGTFDEVAAYRAAAQEHYTNAVLSAIETALIPTKPEAGEPELETLRAALRYARPLLVKYAYTQGNSADFVREITAPVDAALQSKKPE